MGSVETSQAHLEIISNTAPSTPQIKTQTYFHVVFRNGSQGDSELKSEMERGDIERGCSKLTGSRSVLLPSRLVS